MRWLSSCRNANHLHNPNCDSQTISTSTGPEVVHKKHTLNCSLMRILYCPFRSPFSLSKLFAGGTRNSFNIAAESNWSSLRAAIFHSERGQAFRASFVFSPLKISSVPLVLKSAITSAPLRLFPWLSRHFVEILIGCVIGASVTANQSPLPFSVRSMRMISSKLNGLAPRRPNTEI